MITRFIEIWRKCKNFENSAWSLVGDKIPHFCLFWGDFQAEISAPHPEISGPKFLSAKHKNPFWAKIQKILLPSIFSGKTCKLKVWLIFC